MRSLLAASHPGPTLAVTTLSGVLAAAAGLGATGTATAVLAVLTGQLSVGWSNDLLDVERDRASGRRDKPLAADRVPRGLVVAATAGALLVCAAASLSLGWLAGSLHLLAVAGGWAYNLGLKRTAWSPVPYAWSFGLLPVFLVLAAGTTPPWWLAVAGALLGCGAHAFNALPDIEDDRRTGAAGLPARMGARASRVAGAACLLGAAVVLVAGPTRDRPGPLALLLLAVAVGLTAAAAAAPGDPRSRRPFALAVGVAVADVLLLVDRSGTLA